MNFNVDRIAVLAGLGSSGRSGLMKEAAAPVTPAPAAKPAASTPPAKAAPAAKAPPAKAAPGAKPMEEEDYSEAYEGYGMHHGKDMDEMYHDEMDEMYHDTMGGMSYGETVYEVDETQLMEALVDMREKRLEEGRVRSAIREELSQILNNREAGSRWLYGNRQPGNSKKGSVARGFLGPGFR